MKNQLIKISTNHLILTLSLIAGLFTWRVMDIRNDWINVDSILYLDSAKAILQGDWHRAYEIYNWPFYSALIALVAKISGLEVLNAAKILNIIFFSITTFSLAKIIEQIRADKLTLLCFALLLFGSKYISGSILPMLLRDEGFWAFLSAAIFFLIRFLSTKKVSNALLWQGAIVVATLFRIEGAIYLVTIPLVVFWYEGRTKAALVDFLKLNSVFIITLICALAALPFLHISAEHIGRLNEIHPQTIFGSITQLFNNRSLAMQPILGKFLMDHAHLALGISLLAITIVKIIIAISIPLLLIAGIHTKLPPGISKQPFPNHIKLTLSAIFITVTLTSMGSIFRSFVLSGRYLIPLALISIVVASVMLATILRHHSSLKSAQRAILIFIIAYFGAQFGKNIWPKSANYNYEKVAVEYIKKENISLDDVTILAPKAAFYANKKDNSVYKDCGLSNKWDCVTSYLNKNSIKTDYILVPFFIEEGKTEQRYKFLLATLSSYNVLREFDNSKKDKKLILFKKVSR